MVVVLSVITSHDMITSVMHPVLSGSDNLIVVLTGYGNTLIAALTKYITDH